ncbi:39S ribosomal protein L40, mitochondrial isoform X1 [Amblyraja radiata]|uniref:39S ribosomal protein L40, mitochondrial isoform X1 n=1 Tax=Amblyraja radiata TaxID=386614 RepID=UPI001403EE55|nr:39S ribosomal protein L40, mitochondrial isoform X1 [Amblyraja radiata]
MAWTLQPLHGLISRTVWNASVRTSHWHTSMLSLRESLPMRAEPKKKKKVDPKREQAVRDRLKKRLKKLERVPPELIPIEDFITPTKFLDESRVRDLPKVTEEETEQRALLMKEWSRYKQKEHKKEAEMIHSMIEAQQEALQELRVESENLYQAAIKRDQGLFPLELQGCSYTPPIPDYQAPDGKYRENTKVYTQ